MGSTNKTSILINKGKKLGDEETVRSYEHMMCNCEDWSQILALT